jgi:hypothetical protein
MSTLLARALAQIEKQNEQAAERSYFNPQLPPKTYEESAAEQAAKFAAMRERLLKVQAKLAYGLKSGYTTPDGSRHQKVRRVATWDVETNPFDSDNQELIVPFIWDLYDGVNHVTYWNKWAKWNTCIDKFIEHIQTIEEPLIIYAHNGGKFDFTFLVRYLDMKRMLIINSRLVSGWIGIHEFRDSFSALPVPLKDMQKEKFDYELLRESKRWDNLNLIQSYLRSDTENLYKFITSWLDTFGNRKTMASAAMSKFKESYNVGYIQSFEQDESLRRFYHGGRVECFQGGAIVPQSSDSYKIYDIISSYPNAMKMFEHPISDAYFERQPAKFDLYDPDLFFVDVIGDNAGALPTHDKYGDLSFRERKGAFSTTAHELRAAVETGSFRIRSVIKAIYNKDRCNFAMFIDKYFLLRLEAIANNDDMYKLFWKLVMNSVYGGFAIDPRRFHEYIPIRFDAPMLDETERLAKVREYYKICDCKREHLERSKTRCECEGYEYDSSTPYYVIIRRVESSVRQQFSFKNVGTAASITGAARSVLLRAIQNATGLVYCDTDSLICESLTDVPFASSEDTTLHDLGRWKLETTATHGYVMGKKTYAFFNEVDGRLEAVKSASKGVQMEPELIRHAALSGEEPEILSKAPTFTLSGQQQYISRKIRNTVDKSLLVKRKGNKVKQVKRRLE